MKVRFKDIQDAFDFVSHGQLFTHQAFLDSETGKIYWYSDIGDNLEELPEDIDDEKYRDIPHKTELDLGKRLVLDFAHEYLPNRADEIEAMFTRRGAYSKLKALLRKEGLLEAWYDYESRAQEKALRAWCKENEINIID